MRDKVIQKLYQYDCTNIISQLRINSYPKNTLHLFGQKWDSY